MDVRIAVLADHASVEQSGKLNIMGVFGEINPPALPFRVPQMYLVIQYEAGLAEVGQQKDIQIRLMAADGDSIFDVQQQMQVGPPKRPGMRISTNQILGMAGLKIDDPGDYHFSILVGGEEKGVVPLRVNRPPERPVIQEPRGDNDNS